MKFNVQRSATYTLEKDSIELFKEKMLEYLDITPGSVSIMGLANDKKCEVQLLLDREIAESEYVRCHPCINTSTLKIKTSDILVKYLPAVKHLAQVVDL